MLATPIEATQVTPARQDVDPSQAPTGPWPSIVCRGRPSSAEARLVASEVRRALCGEDRVAAPLGPIEVLCRLGGYRLRERRLRAARGGLQGVLAPVIGGFEVTVDPEPRGGWSAVAPHLRSDLRRHRLRFLVAHEIGHSFFYERGPASPRRLEPDDGQDEEFCDEFARALLLPPVAVARVPATPATIGSLQQRFDVSLELTARAVAAANPTAWVAVFLERPDGVAVQWTSAMKAPSWVRAWIAESVERGALEGERETADWTVRLKRLPPRRQVVVVGHPAA